jgi:hypothetical protein
MRSVRLHGCPIHLPSQIFRANSSSEGTNLFCRLPLPTLFYRPEATHLGDLLRLWVRSDGKFKELPPHFQGPGRVARMECETPLEGVAVPIAGRSNSGELTASDRGDGPGPDSTQRLRVHLRRRARPEGLSPSGAGIRTCFPFGTRVR